MSGTFLDAANARIVVNPTGAPAIPTGPAGGQLGGTYPNPTVVGLTETSGPTALTIGAIANGQVLTRSGSTVVGSNPVVAGSAAGGDLTGTYPNPTVAAGAITDTKVAAANKDGLAAVPSMRTLGTGAQQAAAGNDARFTDARPPNGAAGGDLAGTYPNPTIALLAVTDAKVAAANKDGLAAVPSMRTLGTGAQQAVSNADARLSDARPPNGAASGQLGGTYPSPDVRGVRETSGPTLLTLGAVPDGQLLIRSGTTIIGSPGVSGPPSGPAGGQLSGTYPNPSVSGLTETSGPTALAYGAIADGTVLVRRAATVVGEGPIAASARKNGTQVLANATDTIPDLDTIEYALGGAFAPTVDLVNNRIQINLAGVYRITAMTTGLGTAAVAASITRTKIRVGAVNVYENITSVTTTTVNSAYASFTRQLAVGNLVDCMFQFSVGSGWTIGAAAEWQPRLSVELVR